MNTTRDLLSAMQEDMEKIFVINTRLQKEQLEKQIKHKKFLLEAVKLVQNLDINSNRGFFDDVSLKMAEFNLKEDQIRYDFICGLIEEYEKTSQGRGEA